jgi:hypothetical protein
MKTYNNGDLTSKVLIGDVLVIASQINDVDECQLICDNLIITGNEDIKFFRCNDIKVDNLVIGDANVSFDATYIQYKSLSIGKGSLMLNGEYVTK